MVQRSTALLILLGHLLVWSTPCPSRPSEQPRPEDASSASAHATHAGHHGSPETTTSAAASGLSLVSPCPCGCDQRPQAAGVSMAPGLALLPAASGFAFHAAFGFALVESTPAALEARRAPPDHVPLVSLS